MTQPSFPSWRAELDSKAQNPYKLLKKKKKKKRSSSRAVDVAQHPAVQLGLWAYTRLRAWQAEARASRVHSITIEDSDPTFDMLQNWLAESVAISSQRSLVACSHSELDGKHVTLRIAANVEREITIDGHVVRVATRTRGSDETEDLPGQLRQLDSFADTLVFEADTYAGRLAIIAKLEELAKERFSFVTSYVPDVWRVDGRSTGWSHVGKLQKRPRESVVLRTGQLERIISNLQDFRASEEEYVRKGVPWHRGVLLYGPPGTGKTSIAKMLAFELRNDLRVLSLSDVVKDSDLSRVISEVNQSDILLIEDVDLFAVAQQRQHGERAESRVTLSGLLNALDGVTTPHGMIVVLSTNDRCALDPALVRPGRIDLVEEIGLPDDEQATRLFMHFYQQPPKQTICANSRTPAQLLEVMKLNMRDPDKAEKLLRVD